MATGMRHASNSSEWRMTTINHWGTILRLAVFLAVALVLGLLAVPRLLDYVARFRSNEMLLITVLALCFGVSLLAAKLGYSVALGSFLIGAVIAESRQIGKIEQLKHVIDVVANHGQVKRAPAAVVVGQVF